MVKIKIKNKIILPYILLLCIIGQITHLKTSKITLFPQQFFILKITNVFWCLFKSYYVHVDALRSIKQKKKQKN